MIGLIVAIALVGVALWLVNKYVPMAEPIKMILNIVVVVALCLYLLNAFDLYDVPIPRLRGG
jgi:hypothetical protein